ncbi:hypothetical protein HYV10_03505 [Candidatus Dependentiae bacterium]|nr:hypothetical protein [Candidatus Dependentiae bacterium]
MRKQYFTGLIIGLLVTHYSVYAMMPAYQNIITDIQGIQGATTYTLIIACDHLEPIIVYAPVTYQESLDNQQITFFMPNTKLGQGVEEISGIIEVMSSGVTIFLTGKLKQKIVADHKICIIIEPLQ